MDGESGLNRGGWWQVRNRVVLSARERGGRHTGDPDAVEVAGAPALPVGEGDELVLDIVVWRG
jgi:hypothetical protein